MIPKTLRFIDDNKALSLLLLMLFEIVNLSLNLYLHSVSKADRKAIRTEQQMSRKMLDARAKIQITLINTGKRRNAFTEDEMKILKENWSEAEYSLVESNPF